MSRPSASSRAYRAHDCLRAFALRRVPIEERKEDLRCFVRLNYIRLLAFARMVKDNPIWEREIKKRLRGLTLRHPDAVFYTVHRRGQGRWSTRVLPTCAATGWAGRGVEGGLGQGRALVCISKPLFQFKRGRFCNHAKMNLEVSEKDLQIFPFAGSA